MNDTDRFLRWRLMLAHLDGQRAAREGRPATVCPHDPASPDAVTRVKARMWLRGYDRVNPMPIDYGD